MIATLVSLLVVAVFAGIVYRFAPTPDERWGALLERYRPHAPMSDWSAAEYEGVRQYSDLAAAYARQDAPPAEVVARRVRRTRSPLADLATIPCREETVQF
ncbi:hypothetical protein OHB26_13050 [Nocardia sp. NBC_01503]|uniref:hypothetical protein n=1 Tax=Nocardia sp. NBC_01503 TaxID=2975997 RepID=UPI002E7B4EAC|nr:hypothetical protein [Nocardia sp. NBC_01503]WTL35034.1 hypothetical protein OHB26_13050 [Nocardia sp. NBC_01503]